MMHFLLTKLSDEEDIKDFVMYFPPRTAKDTIELKQLMFTQLIKLEKENRIAKNFILGKSVLDTYHGERV